MIDHLAGEQRTERSADSHRRRDRALRQIVPAAAAHDVGYDQRRQRPIDARTYPVEQLNADQPEGVVRQNIERRADRQHGEGDEENRPSSPGIRPAPDEDRDRQHHALGGDHAERHHRGRLFWELDRELLADQRQKRRIGEVEQHRAESENHQRTSLKQYAISGRLSLRFAIGGKVSRPVVVDCIRWNGEHGRRGQGREHRNHEKDGALRERVSDRACEERNRNIAAVVESRVAR